MNPLGLVNDLLVRLPLAIGIIGLGILLYHIANAVILAHAGRRMSGLEKVRLGEPVLLYFTTPGCVPCKTVQRPAIQELKERVEGKLQVIEVDASAQPELASQWGVLSVPTTFVIDSHGKPRHVNHGVATTDKLLKQILEVYS